MLKSINSFENLIDTAWSFRISKIIFTAIELNVFNILSNKPLKARELIKELKLFPLAGEFFLNSLTALGLLQKENGKYLNSEISEKFLVEKSAHYRGDILKHFHNGWGDWSGLETVIQKKITPKKQKDDDWKNFILGMYDLGIERAKKMLDLIDMSKVKNMLDLGGGPGIYSITFAEKHPDLKTTVFDLAKTIKIAREVIKKHKLKERVLTKEGNFIYDELGDNYDMVLVSNILHSFGHETNKMLVSKVFKSLENGGKIIVNDFILNEDKTSPLHAVLFGLHMIVNTNEGKTYTGSEIKDMLEKAGFKKIELIPLDMKSKLVVGWK